MMKLIFIKKFNAESILIFRFELSLLVQYIANFIRADSKMIFVKNCKIKK